MTHNLIDVDDFHRCITCGSWFDYPRPAGACHGAFAACPENDGANHHFGVDGHCHICGEVDRG